MFVSVVPVTGSCDDVVTLYVDSRLTQVRVGCMGGWACPGRTAVVEYCDRSTLDDQGRPRLEHGAQKIHLTTLGDCDPLV